MKKVYQASQKVKFFNVFGLIAFLIFLLVFGYIRSKSQEAEKKEIKSFRVYSKRQGEAIEVVPGEEGKRLREEIESLHRELIERGSR